MHLQHLATSWHLPTHPSINDVLRARNATKLVLCGLPPGRLNHAGITSNTCGESPGEVSTAAAAAGTADGTGAKTLEVIPEAAALSGDVVDTAGGNGPAVL